SILENMAQHIKNSGIIVYCTCSLEHEENWAVVDRFLQKHKEFKVEPAWNLIDKKYCDERGAIFIIPHRHKMTGSFAVRLIKYNGQK
ncbi:MAG TPA: 16S rRNA (cytosine(967)-C(5))-methyltransferase RsmB, partial [Candidatus Marinimicrobia bacterium]|nr:16S rRNA (cytosine(967)-C(5))-methyltransferase RsmB [Candidatus Neomarinimicrobiota bacterium]